MSSSVSLTNTIVVPPYLWSIQSKTSGGCHKLQIVPNPVYTVFLPIYTYPWLKLNLQIRHSKSLTIITNNKIAKLQQYAAIKVMWMCSLSEYLIILYSPILNCGSPRVTETLESKTTSKAEDFCIL